jgi:hypothetical protein
MIRMDGKAFGVAAFSIVCLTVIWLAGGCGGSPTVNDRLKTEFDTHPEAKPAGSMAKFAGKVTVDGQPPNQAKGKHTLIFLFPDKDPKPAVHTSMGGTNAEGHFSFSTFAKDDGVPSGKYIVTFAELTQKGKGQFVSYLGPDGLKNLYNDPDKAPPEFHIEITSPGKTDHLFELKTASKEPIANPGPRAVKEVKDEK